MHGTGTHEANGTHGKNEMYVRLLGMAVLSFMSMYVLMFAMVDVLDNVVHNVNQVYMAALMTAPMVLIELALMRGMYQDNKLNLAVAVVGILVFVASFSAIRQQAGIGDGQFLRSMIPHHAGAILMCQQSSISDPEIIELCRGINKGQQSEIDQMRAIMRRLDE